MPIDAYREPALFVLVSIAAVNDLATRRIPNRLVLAGLVCVLVLDLFSTLPGDALLRSVGGIGVGFAAFLPFYLVRGMAAGDVKLMAMVGAFTGPAEAFEVAVLTWCVGGVMALLVLLVRGRFRLALGNIWRIATGMTVPNTGSFASAQTQSVGTMPYGVAIAVGTVAVLVRHYG